MTTAAIYARYSTDLQNDASIEDQVRVCKEFAAKHGWKVVKVFSDRAMSGSNMIRPGIQDMMLESMDGSFEIVVTEALDRLSRDQADIATFYKRMRFADIAIHTISEGEVNEMHIGLMGTMNALQLQEIKRKVRRGMRGRIENGKSAGGLPYGYRVVKALDENGELIRGDREIVEEEAGIIRRIMEEYAGGMAPKAIVHRLNAEGIPGPTGGDWSPSTIHGNRRRGIGILNNEMYIGVLVWNRQRFIKDPDTGKRVTRYNDEADWVRQDVPHLRIVDEELWARVKAKQRDLPDPKEGFWKAQRPKYLLSGLLKCGTCGSGFNKANHGRYACVGNRQRGTCDNDLKIEQTILEETVLNTLKAQLMQPELCQEFCTEYVRWKNEVRKQKNAQLHAWKKEHAKVLKAQSDIVDAIVEGTPAAMVKDRANQLEDRRLELEALLEGAEEETVLLHPNMADRYTDEVEQLIEILNDEHRRTEATSLLRSLIEKIVLTPNQAGDALKIDLHGDLAGIMNVALGKKNKVLSTDNDFDDISVLKLVAEEGLEPPTRGL